MIAARENSAAEIAERAALSRASAVASVLFEDPANPGYVFLVAYDTPGGLKLPTPSVVAIQRAALMQYAATVVQRQNQDAPSPLVFDTKPQLKVG